MPTLFEWRVIVTRLLVKTVNSNLDLVPLIVEFLSDGSAIDWTLYDRKPFLAKVKRIIPAKNCLLVERRSGSWGLFDGITCHPLKDSIDAKRIIFHNGRLFFGNYTITCWSNGVIQWYMSHVTQYTVIDMLACDDYLCIITDSSIYILDATDGTIYQHLYVQFNGPNRLFCITGKNFIWLSNQDHITMYNIDSKKAVYLITDVSRVHCMAISTDTTIFAIAHSLDASGEIHRIILYDAITGTRQQTIKYEGAIPISIQFMTNRVLLIKTTFHYIVIDEYNHVKVNVKENDGDYHVLNNRLFCVNNGKQLIRISHT